MSHTKEPWRLGRFTGPASYEAVRETVGATDIVVDTETGVYVLAQCNNNFPEDAKANARRIVACVNACAGIETHELELMTGRMSIASQIKACDAIYATAEAKATRRSKFARQRDELLAAAEAIEINAEECMGFDDCTAMLVPIDDYHKLMDAIATAKGGV